MDDQRFDGLAKRVASTSRRKVLSSLLGGATVLVGGHAAHAAPKCIRQCRACTTDADCCGSRVCRFSALLPGYVCTPKKGGCASPVH